MSHHETTIITGALDLTQKMAKDAMTPIAETFCLDINSKIDMYVPTFYLWVILISFFSIITLRLSSILRHTMGLVLSKGHSRIPVYSGSPKNIIGLILVSSLGTKWYCRIYRIELITHMDYPTVVIKLIFEKSFFLMHKFDHS